MANRRPIVVVGSINTDLVATGDRIPAVGETVIGTGFQIHPGGKGANQAVAVARLGYPVRMIGRLGHDDFGTRLRQHMESVGVDCSLIASSEEPSGVAIILVSKQGQNCIMVTPGANAKVTPQDVEANVSVIREAGMVLAQLEIPIETVECLAAVCAREGVPLMLDPAPATNLPPSLFANVSWFTPNETEAAYYSGAGNDGQSASAPADVAAALLAKGCRGVLLKMGARGAWLATRDIDGHLIPAFAVSAVDSTAAGDAFNGGFAAALMLGRPPLDSAMFAAAVAAISVTRPGAQPSMPTMAETEDFLDKRLLSR